MNFEELKDWKKDARRGLEHEIERLSEKEEQISSYMRALDATDELLTEVDNLKEEVEELNETLERLQAENDTLRQQLLDEKEQKQAAETRLSELNKLSAGVAKKSSQDDLLKAMRSYLNISRRKTLGKREAAKMVFMELLTSTQVELPEDIMELLSHLDDEQAESTKVVNVTGNYNDIHGNGNVGLNEIKE